MTEEEIQKTVTEILVADFECDPGKLTPDVNLFTDLDLDSIDALELGMAVKKAFGVTFAADPAENRKIFYSVKTLADFVEQQNKADQT